MYGAEVDCGSPASIIGATKGIQRVDSGYTLYGAVVDLECPDGQFFPDKVSFISLNCFANGSWSQIGPDFFCTRMHSFAFIPLFSSTLRSACFIVIVL